MNEDFFDNFWVSEQKPENLPQGWIWVSDILDLDVLINAYNILYPDGAECWGKKHYVCLSIYDCDIIEWSDIWDNDAFILIWRPPMEENYEEEDE